MANNDKLYWVDTDAGVDDAVAILWALNNDFNIIGFSTVAGNLAVESTVRNVSALLEYSNKDIPVYYGASYATIGGHIDASHIHGVNLGPIVIDKDYKAKDHVFNGLINFFESSDISNLIDRYKPIMWAIFAISLLILGYKIMLNKKRDRHINAMTETTMSSALFTLFCHSGIAFCVMLMNGSSMMLTCRTREVMMS